MENSTSLLNSNTDSQPKPRRGKRNVALYLDEGLLARIDVLAELQNLTRSWLVSTVMASWLDEAFRADDAPPRLKIDDGEWFGCDP